MRIKLLAYVSAGLWFGAAPLGAAALGQGYVRDIAFAPDGERVAVARPTLIEIWDSSLHHLITTVPLTAYSLAWSPDSSKLAIQDYWTTVWDVRGASRVSYWVNGCNGDWLSWSPAGDRIVEAGGCTKQIYGVDGKHQLPLLSQTRPSGVAWSPAGNYVALLLGNGVELWDPDSGKLLRSISFSGAVRYLYQKHPVGLAWSPREPLLATCDGLNSVQIWSEPAGDLLTTMQAAGDTHIKLAWSRDGKQVALATDQFLTVWEARSGKRLRELRSGLRIALASFSPTLDRAVAANNAGEFEVWDLASGKSERVNSRNAEWEHVAWSPQDLSPQGRSPQDSILASWGGSGVVQIWEPASGLLRAQFQAAVWGDRSVVWSSDGHWLAAAADDGSVSLHDPLAGDVIRTLHGARPPVYAISQSPDKTRLAAVAGGWLWVWDLSQTGPPRQWPIAGRQLAWGSDGTIMVVTMDDSAVEIDVATGKRTWSVNLETEAGRGWLTRVWLSADGHGFVGGQRQRVWLRDDFGTPRQTEVSLTGDPLFSCTPDGRQACYISPSGSLAAYDLRSGQQRELALPRLSAQRSAAISGDGRLASGARGIIIVTSTPAGVR